MLQFLRNFFREAAKSCYDMEFYRVVRAESPWKSVKYAARLFGLMAAIGAVAFIPSLIMARDGFVSHIKTRLPDGARFELSAEGLSTNVEMPFELGLKDASIVLDPSIKGLEAPAAAKDSLIFGEDAAFFPREGGETQVVSYADLPRFSVTKADIVSKLDMIGWPFVVLASLTLVLAWLISTMLGTSAYVLVLSGLFWVGANMAKTPLRYSQWVAVGFRAITLPTLIMIAFGATLGRIPFLSTAIYGMFMVSIIMDERSNPSSGSGVSEIQGPPPPGDKDEPPTVSEKPQ